MSDGTRDRAALTAAQFKLVREAFRQALEAGEAERSAVVATATEGDELLCAHVMELLGADAAAGGLANVGSAGGGGLVQRMIAAEGTDAASGTAWWGTAELSEQVPERLGRYRAGDIRHCYANVGLAETLLGFQASVSLEQGVTDLIPWLSDQQVVDRVDQATRELVARRLAR